MNIILVGCEFAGKTTLANEIVEWSKVTFGGYSHFHDHFTIPSSELTDEAKEEYRLASPQIKEMFQRFMIQYHISTDFFSNLDHNLMGIHIEEAVYAPLYYGYGGKNSGAPLRSPVGQRSEMARMVEAQILTRAPNVVLVLVKASSEVIQVRMNNYENTRVGDRDSEPFGVPTRGIVKPSDVDHVIERLEEEFNASILPNKIVLDTSSATISETRNQFIKEVDLFLSETDRRRRAEYLKS